MCSAPGKHNCNRDEINKSVKNSAVLSLYLQDFCVMLSRKRIKVEMMASKDNNRRGKIPVFISFLDMRLFTG